MNVLTTARLTLRQWQAADLVPFAALNADPVTMEFLGCLGREHSDAFAARAGAELEARGWGMWAVELNAQRRFIGCVGLSVPSFQAPFTPCVEIAWRLGRENWGRGYASEAARECLRFAFETLLLPEVLAFTIAGNERSQALMRRLGMRRDPAGDFDHPRLPPRHPLCRHLLYRMPVGQWRATAAAGE